MKTKMFVLGAIAATTISCNTETNNVNIPNPEVEQVQELVEEVAKAPLGRINVDATQIGFGAFKTTEKVEVKGWFQSFVIEGVNQEAATWQEAITGAWVTIDVPSIETNDVGRNKKVLEHFFGSTASNELIAAKVLSVDSTLAVLEIDFNGLKKPVDFQVELSNDTLNLTATIDVADFDATSAISAINKACEALHKGADGVSKTWSEVNLYVSTVIRNKN